ncbi:unnamed protein product, partial [Arctogadus glacialis]
MREEGEDSDSMRNAQQCVFTPMHTEGGPNYVRTKHLLQNKPNRPVGAWRRSRDMSV